MIIFLSFCIGLTTWPKELIQLEQYILIIVQAPSWLTKRKYGQYYNLSLPCYYKELKLTWIPSMTKMVSLITSAKIRGKFCTHFTNWITLRAGKMACSVHINDSLILEKSVTWELHNLLVSCLWSFTTPKWKSLYFQMSQFMPCFHLRCPVLGVHMYFLKENGVDIYYLPPTSGAYIRQ